VDSPTGISTIADVIARMRTIDASLPRKDGVAIFNRLYLQVTLAVDSASSGTAFENPQFIERLDVIFAGLYFDAEATIGSGGDCPRSWRPLMEARSDRREPIQFALAGMTAHIHHDLPLAVVMTCEEMGLAPDDAIHRDYQRVDALLADVEKKVAGWFDSGLIADIEDVSSVKTDEAVAMWSIVAARDMAWERATHLWELRHAGMVHTAYLEELALSTELDARVILA
jgi:Family of unknown function (DUF5995)